MVEIENKFEGYIQILGKVIEEDASFDHEFGVREMTDYTVRDMKVFAWINDTQYDITAMIKPYERLSYERMLIDEYLIEEMADG
jgi:hypothetical protein